jgi:hypothetical protein
VVRFRFEALLRSPADTSSRRTLLAAGGAAALATVAGAAPANAAAYEGAELGWRFCPKCRGLFKGKGTKSTGACPAGGKHEPRKDVEYILYRDGNWPHWWRCSKCAGLFYVVFILPEEGTCPKGGSHASDDARSFTLWSGAGTPGVTDDAWDACTKCQGLFNWAAGNVGSCPAGGGHQRNGAAAKLVSLY